MKPAPSVRHNIIANFAGTVWTGIFSLAFIPIYVKIMGVEVYGLIGVFMSLSAVLALLDMGLSATMSRELSRLSVVEDSAQESQNLVRTFEVIYWGIGIFLGVIVILLAPLITKYWVSSTSISSETVEKAFIIMGVLLASQWPGAIYTGGLRGLQRQVVLNVIRIISVTLKHVGAVIVLLFISSSILSFFLWQTFIALLTTVFLAIWLWRSLPNSESQSKFDKGLVVKNWRFASGMMGISFMTMLLTQLDKIILSKMLTLEMFGYYMLAFSVANALHGLVSPIMTALFPKFTQLVTSAKESNLIILYHKGCQLLSVMVLPVAITVAVFSKDILAIWLEDTLVVQNTYQILTLLMIGTALNAIMTPPYILQLAHGWTKLALYKNIIAVICVIPLMVWLVDLFQGVGAAWAWIVLNLGYLIFEIPIMHRRILKTEMWKWYLIDYTVPMISVLIIGYVSYVFMPSDLPVHLGFAWAVVTFLVGAILLILILPFTREKAFQFGKLASEKISQK